jgi:hypothetical protein
MQLKWKYKDHQTNAWSIEGAHLCNYTLYHKDYQDRFQTLRMHLHSNNARNLGGSFPWKIWAYHFPKGVNLHVETKTKFSWEIFGPKNELKRGGEKNWSIRNWRKNKTCIGRSFNEKEISLVTIAIVALSSCQLQQS